MIDNQKSRRGSVSGSNQEPLTLDSLPPPETYRWVPRLKAQVAAAVKAGLLTAEEACSRYGLSPEEFLSWQRAFDRLGLAGWQVARMQHYRELHDRLHQSAVCSQVTRPSRRKTDVTRPE